MRAALAVCVLLVLAGCHGPAGPRGTATSRANTAATTSATTTTTAPTPTTDTPPSTPQTTTRTTTQDRIRVDGGSLPYDVQDVWRRVETMLAVDVSGPATIRITPMPPLDSVAPTRFERALGVEPRAKPLKPTALTVDSGDVVQLNEKRLDSSGGLEWALAHEYVHVVQSRNRSFLKVVDALGGLHNRDNVLVFSAIREGTAMYVMQEYQRRFLSNASGSKVSEYRNATSATKSFLAPYVFGKRYVAATVDSPKQVDSVYENPPRTTEELVHALPPGSEPPANLSVSVESTRQHARNGPFGELYVRTLFGTSLNESRAARLADGWGNDVRVRFGSGNASDYAWVLRWDDPANATEFTTGVRAYLDAVSVPASARLERVSPETVVLFVGSESFVANAEATGSNASVTVFVPENESAAAGRPQTSVGNTYATVKPTSRTRKPAPT